MISPCTVAQILDRVKWARDDVREGRASRRKKIRHGYLDMARRNLEEAIAELERLHRDAWEET
jgi:hypothetical protein